MSRNFELNRMAAEPLYIDLVNVTFMYVGNPETIYSSSSSRFEPTYCGISKSCCTVLFSWLDDVITPAMIHDIFQPMESKYFVRVCIQLQNLDQQLFQRSDTHYSFVQ